MKRKIYITYGTVIEKMTEELLEAVNAAALIGQKNSKIVLKPNLVVPSDPSDGATTHTEIIEAIICYLQERGFDDITIAESSWVGARTEDAFNLLGYHRIEKEYGIKLLDIKKDRFETVERCGMKMEVSKTILDADFLIDIPVLKGHCQTKMTHAVKNLKGCISDRSKREFHRLGLDKPIAVLGTIIKPDLVISDGIAGDLDFEEGGNPVESWRMMASRDAFLMDSYSALLMGYRPEEIGYLREAEKLGIRISSDDAEITELSKPIKKSARPSGYARKLASNIAEDEACSACFASLVRALKKADDTGCLGNLKGRKIAIGQGYRGKCIEIGAGACCSNAKHSAEGCPVSAEKAYEMIRSLND